MCVCARREACKSSLCQSVRIVFYLSLRRSVLLCISPSFSFSFPQLFPLLRLKAMRNIHTLSLSMISLSLSRSLSCSFILTNVLKVIFAEFNFSFTAHRLPLPFYILDLSPFRLFDYFDFSFALSPQHPRFVLSTSRPIGS